MKDIPQKTPPKTITMRGRLRLQKFSYRFAEQVLNSKLALKEEIEIILTEEIPDLSALSRPGLNKLLDERFTFRGWTRQPAVFQDAEALGAKMDFLKERIGIEVGFGHASFLGIDLLKFQVSSYSALDKIDVGIYIATTAGFQRRITNEFGQNWDGSLTFEKIVKYLPHFKSAIQVPIYVIGLGLDL
jgi:Restriction endonuclease BglII